MKLYTQTSGNGPDLVLIHGWGLNGDVWSEFVPLLEPAFRVTRVDLPGHGRSGWNGRASLDDWVSAILAVVPDMSAWLGWSLGGLIANRAAMVAPARVSALAVVAGTPCFVRKPDWQSAMQPQLLDTFANELAEDYTRTLERFLALQVRGSDNASATLKSLRSRLLAPGEPDNAALMAGLNLLRETDLRDQLASIACPVRLVMGERDMLVPLSAGDEAVTLYQRADLQVVTGAGHAPFISQPQLTAELLKDFLLQHEAASGGSLNG